MIAAARHLRLARFGERVAARFLIARGADVIARNLKVGRGEIDLVVRIDGTLVAVEVKTRSGADHGDPADHFTAAKARRVRSLAGSLRPPVHRVDFIGVSVSDGGVDVRWIPSAG